MRSAFVKLHESPRLSAVTAMADLTACVHMYGSEGASIWLPETIHEYMMAWPCGYFGWSGERISELADRTDWHGLNVCLTQCPSQDPPELVLRRAREPH